MIIIIIFFVWTVCNLCTRGIVSSQKSINLPIKILLLVCHNISFALFPITAHNSNMSVIDITSIITKACEEELSMSKSLLHNQSFNLYDSMCALELTDAKMDSCEIPIAHYTQYNTSLNNDSSDYTTVPPRPRPKSLNSLPWEKLSIFETRVILSQFITNLDAFVNGSSLAETVFTSYYLYHDILNPMTKVVQRVDTITNTTMAQRLLCIACHLTILNAKLIRKIVIHADIYEEEDFVTNAYFLLNSNSDDDDCGINYMPIETITTMYQEHLSSSNTNKDNVDVSIIHSIIQFLLDFHHINHNLSTQLKLNDVVQLTTEMKTFIDGPCIHNLNHLVQSLSSLSSSNQGQQQHSPPTTTELLLFQTFDPFVNRHLLGNAPVRNVVPNFYTKDTKSIINSIQSFVRITKELSDAVCTLLLDGQDLNMIYSILHYITHSAHKSNESNINSNSKISPLNIITRSLVVINLFFNDKLLGQHNLPTTIANNLSTYYNVPATIVEETEYGIQFLHRLGKPIYDAIKLYLLNLGRQRGFLESVIFKDWSVLLQEAAVVDHCFHQDYLSADDNGDTSSNNSGNSTMIPFMTNYVLFKITELIDRHISVGIEVDLFNGCWHLFSAYWYLDFLNSTRLNLLVTMQDFMKQRKAMEKSMLISEMQEQQGVGLSKGGKKKGKKVKKNQSKKQTSNYHNLDTSLENEEDNMVVLIMKMKQLMHRGIVRVSSCDFRFFKNFPFIILQISYFI